MTLLSLLIRQVFYAYFDIFLRGLTIVNRGALSLVCFIHIASQTILFLHGSIICIIIHYVRAFKTASLLSESESPTSARCYVMTDRCNQLPLNHHAAVDQTRY